MSKNHILPKKINNCIQRLTIEYETQNKIELSRILNNCEATVIDTYYEDNDDVYMHTLNLSLPPEFFGQYLSLSNQEKLSEHLKTDINKVLSIPMEYVCKVNFELNNKLTNSSITLKKRKKVYLKELKFWKPDYLKVFISHSVSDYKVAKKLKCYMEEHWFSCFVAHKDISLTKKWKEEIIKALNSMEVFIILISQKCKESDYVNQEVGFALSRSVPIIPVKLDDNDPPGFISEIQAITLNRENIEDETLNMIVSSIKGKFPEHISLRKKALNDFFDSQSTSYQRAGHTFMKLIKYQFDDLEIDQIVEAIICKELRTKGNYGTVNQLKILLSDKYYAELIRDKILAQHTKQKYTLKSYDDDYKIINNDEINEDKIQCEELIF